MTKREQVLGAMRVAGYHSDDRTFLRLYTENRISYAAAMDARADGARAKVRGVPCTCRECGP